MRLFDESDGIKHSSRLMHTKRVFCNLLACGIALAVSVKMLPAAQAPADTNSPSASTASASTSANTGVVTNTTNPNSIPTYSGPPPHSLNSSNFDPEASLSMPGHTRQTRMLSLEDCIRLALEHNLDIQISRYNPIINDYTLDVSYGAYEPTFTFSASKNYNDSPGGVVTSQNIVSPDSITETIPVEGAITGVLPTGLTYDLFGPWQRNTFLTQGPTGPSYFSPPSWTAGPGITLTQPLLKNFWIDSTRLQIEINKDNLKISEEALRLQIMTSITTVKDAYFNLQYARGNVDANATAYKLAEQLVKENLKRVEVGSLAPLDEKQSESQAAASLAAMQAAEQALIVQENLLKNLITDNYAEWVNVSLLPADKLIAIPMDLDLQESWRRAMKERPELVEAQLKIKQQDATVGYDLNQIFPTLNVSGTYGRNANENTIGNNFGEIQQGNHSFYSYGASVSIPLGGSYQARSQYKAGKASLKQLQLTLQQVQQGIIVAVDNDVGSVRSSLQQVYATRDARIYAEDALAAEQKKLENGKSTSFIVLQLISNLTAARVAEVQALANYNIAVAQLALDEGSTLDANHIKLKVR